MLSKTARTIDALYRLKMATSKELSDITDIPAEDISTNLRAIVRAKKYGVYVHGKGNRTRGTEANIWAIDEAKYREYMEYKRHLEATQRPPPPKRKHVDLVTPREEKYVYNREFPRPITQYHTRWQPSSPYYKENP